ncbi:hypothetical protein FOCC_FOCC006228 [Frankliniella occidentalis]|nr:hypothetical protein FOCC_FOCC006228 [Frankliniella occidentalis]
MADKNPAEQVENLRRRNRNTKNQRKRRATMTEDQIAKKRAYDRTRYYEKKKIQSSSLPVPDTSLDNDFQSSRLRVSQFKKRIEFEMNFYSIESEHLLFEKKLEALHIVECNECDTFYWSSRGTCYCNISSDVVRLFHEIGEVPEELKELSYVEELLISKVHPMISIYRLKGGQYAYKGNVINFRQDVASFCKELPHSVAVLNGLISVCCNTQCFHQDFLIRRNKVSIALHWLKLNNVYYHDISIDLDKILKLPEKGYYSNLVNIPVVDVDNPITDANESSEIDRVQLFLFIK